MAEVRLHDGESIENLLRRFKRQVLQEDILKETKRRSYYLKPGQKKRLKSELARKRERKRRTREARPKLDSPQRTGH
ncbi:MAG TPA: 30S ribosomal protein S21 [Bryobacteraceae bacterium]